MEFTDLTLENFEEAAEVVKRVTQETKLVYSKYFSEQTGNKVYLKPENMQITGAYKNPWRLLPAFLSWKKKNRQRD